MLSRRCRVISSVFGLKKSKDGAAQVENAEDGHYKIEFAHSGPLFPLITVGALRCLEFFIRPFTESIFS